MLREAQSCGATVLLAEMARVFVVILVTVVTVVMVVMVVVMVVVVVMMRRGVKARTRAMMIMRRMEVKAVKTLAVSDPVVVVVMVATVGAMVATMALVVVVVATTRRVERREMTRVLGRVTKVVQGQRKNAR